MVVTLFESLGPLGLWVSVLAGGPYNIRRARAYSMLNLQRKPFWTRGIAKVNASKEKKKHIEGKSMRRHGIEIQSDKDLRFSDAVVIQNITGKRLDATLWLHSSFVLMIYEITRFSHSNNNDQEKIRQGPATRHRTRARKNGWQIIFQDVPRRNPLMDHLRDEIKMFSKCVEIFWQKSHSIWYSDIHISLENNFLFLEIYREITCTKYDLKTRKVKKG